MTEPETTTVAAELGACSVQLWFNVEWMLEDGWHVYRLRRRLTDQAIVAEGYWPGDFTHMTALDVDENTVLVKI